MKKKILGLDLGAASIGWALISENNQSDNTERSIIAMGSRIIPYEGTEGSDFSKGKGESRNSLRTRIRTARRNLDRYQLRRKLLENVLHEYHMYPDEGLINLPKMKLWELRNNAIGKKVSLKELGRILMWLNQKRGYKSSRSDVSLNKKDTEYVVEVKSRHEKIKELNLTIGQYFYQKLLEDNTYRIKENIFPREAYIEEFDAIIENQKSFYPEILIDKLIDKIRNEIIYYQRPLKSQKGLVSICEFEGFHKKSAEGKEYFVGPRVAPKSSPLFQIAKIWENINNIQISSKKGEDIELNADQKNEIFNFLDNNEKLTADGLFKILGLTKNEHHVNKQLQKGLQGNITKASIIKCLEDLNGKEELLNLNLKVISKSVDEVDKETGEIIGIKEIKYIDPSVEKALFYQLWHTIYSIPDQNKCIEVLQKRFFVSKKEAENLYRIDFTKQGFGNKSAKTIRKILPYLMEGYGYSDAMNLAGYNHSNSITKEENLKRVIANKLKLLPKNSLRQPVVEKILNQMINLINALIEKYGNPDEIRIELARELKQSKDERNDTERFINQRNRENEAISKRIEEYGLKATRNNIIKWRLYEEIDNQEKKLNAICIYCGQPISLIEALKGSEVDVEHIIPRVKFFDDSQSNKTLAHRKCNKDKDDLTAFDFMKSKSEQEFNAYLERVNLLFNNKIISKTKRDKLLMAEAKIPKDFIDRQLRESQYIARKAKEILSSICHHVFATSGTVTSELRHLWGWDDITMNLQMPKYKEMGLTKIVEWESDRGKNKHQKEIIKGWTKRDDHRHHAIDALVIACTKQGFIQRFNTLSSGKTRNAMAEAINDSNIVFNGKKSLLEKYIISQRPFSVEQVEDAVARILISYKSGKKVAVKGIRKIGNRGNKKVVQKGIIVPRGALSEESVYGKILTVDKQRNLKHLFENSELIVNKKIKKKIEERLLLCENDPKRAYRSLKQRPVYLDKDKSVEVRFGSCYKEEYVIKYPVDINFTKVEKVVDEQIKDVLLTRLQKFTGKPKEAFKDVQKNGLIMKWYEDEGLTRPIKSVRCYTGLQAVEPVKKDENGKDIGFVKPGNNHHIGVYIDTEGNFVEHVCTFWHAVERKKYQIPIIIENSNEVWDEIMTFPEGKYPESFLNKLPKPNLELLISLQQNEMFILGLDKIEVEKAVQEKDYALLSKYLYRVQKLASSYYTFRHHLETQLIDNTESLNLKRFYRIRSLKSLFELNPYKVRLDYLGIVKENQEDLIQLQNIHADSE